MRDLEKDLKFIEEEFNEPICPGNSLEYEFRAKEGWPEAVRRAIAAEARIKELEARLTDEKIKELEAQHSVAIEALKKLRDLLPEFSSPDRRIWKIAVRVHVIIDEALAALEGGGSGA